MTADALDAGRGSNFQDVQFAVLKVAAGPQRPGAQRGPRERSAPKRPGRHTYRPVAAWHCRFAAPPWLPSLPVPVADKRATKLVTATALPTYGIQVTKSCP